MKSELGAATLDRRSLPDEAPTMSVTPSKARPIEGVVPKYLHPSEFEIVTKNQFKMNRYRLIDVHKKKRVNNEIFNFGFCHDWACYV
jgi:hypothetical protein